MALMGIGEFARLSRVSPKALRRHDELGLLPPSRVDPGSGYRWYSAGQLDQARLVAALRQIGVPLAQIKMIVGLAPAAAAEQVDAYWACAESDHAARRELACYGYDAVRKPAMARFHDVRPAAIVRCRTPADASAAIGFAARRAVGVDPVRRPLGNGPLGHRGMVIDVTPMSRAEVSDGIASVGAGAWLGNYTRRWTSTVS